ncbi:MAG: hydantoinase B/oxoprolinase family protein, partial [Mariprofundaceae bacterium]
LVAQAAHIPVHLGSMAYCMRDVVRRFDWRAGDEAVFNDPFLGGTHLPDITLVHPIFTGNHLAGFAASRAHHTDVGGDQPGSMGVSRSLAEEGVVIAPRLWRRAGVQNDEAMQTFLHCVRNPHERLGDFAAQRAACALGVRGWEKIAVDIDVPQSLAALLAAAEEYGKKAVAAIPDGAYAFSDAIEDDGVVDQPLTLACTVRIDGDRALVDFSGTARQCEGPMNCPLSVTAAAVFYVFRCLMPAHTPQSSAIFRPIDIHAPTGCLINARPGAAVAAGNVETSQRIVDVLLGALAQAMPERIPAASQGTMNNVIFGGRNDSGDDWAYYETIGGGMGAGHGQHGLSGVQCHMTNTKNTSIEVVEMHYPIRIRRYGMRRGSGGMGAHRGGGGLVREWQTLTPCDLSILSERRVSSPFGLNGGEAGAPGHNILIHDGARETLPGKCVRRLQAGDILRIETPGGGGFGLENGKQTT